MHNYAEQAANGKRWCYDCVHFYHEHTCGYSSCNCYIHGSLDVGQKERHPDKTADTCRDYTPNGKEPWYKKYVDNERNSVSTPYHTFY